MEKSIAFQIGPLTFYWYGIILATGILAGFWAAVWQAKRRGDNAERLLDILFYALPASIIGARLYYVIFSWEQYRDNPWEALAIWHGGLAIHGAIIAAVLVLIVYTRYHKLSFWHWADICAPSLVLGQAIGRWGNFVNQEAFGSPVNLPWAIYIDIAHRPSGYEQYALYHPTFLYESIWNCGVFIVLQLLSSYQRKTNRLVTGGIALSYFALYSAGRFFIEGLRLDSLMWGSFRAAQLISIVLLLVSLSFLYYKQKSNLSGISLGKGALMTPLERVEQFLRRYPDLKPCLLEVSTHTSELAARALGVERGQIAKTLVFAAGEDTVLVVTSGDQKVNTRKLAKALGTGAGKVKLADPLKIMQETGFSAGGVSPVGLLNQLPVYLDKSMQRYAVVYTAAGTDNSALPVAPERLQEITGGIWVDVS